MLEEQQEQRRLKLEAQQEQQRQREEAKRENERLAQEARQQNANRLPSLASATRAMGCDSGNTGDGFGGYAEKLAAKLKPLIGRPTTAGNVLAVLEVQAKPDGAISVIQLRVASGVKEWVDILPALKDGDSHFAESSPCLKETQDL